MLQKYLFGRLALVVYSIMLVGYCSNVNSNSQNINKPKGAKIMSLGSSKLKDIDSLSVFERNIAKKLMLSVRYFCKDGSDKNKRCLDEVTELPPELFDFFSQIEVAGVVTFAENYQSVKQILKLTSDLRKAGRNAGSSHFLIGIDQEGGRVVRLPRKISTAFSGNMAISATYDRFGTQFSRTVGSVIGKELSRLGINLNFSPDIDVNNNPDNPVINTRSFGEDPARVSELGLAMMESIQQQNVMATLKHFPGHGNTHVDSHTGLPSVNLTKEEMDKIELAPFKYAIQNGKPAMVMTAHIQYPKLDSTRVKNIQGDSVVVPATMSYKLITEILKNELGFQGVVITDAMNMAGISANFELAEATAHSFLAGVDITLMPYPIRTEKDIQNFVPFVKKVARLMERLSADRISRGDLLAHTNHSISRIESLKQQFQLKHDQDKEESKKITWKNDQYRHLENTLAEKSISSLKVDSNKYPLAQLKDGSTLHILTRNNEQKEAIENAFIELSNNGELNSFKLKFTLLNKSIEDLQNLVTNDVGDLADAAEHLIIFEQDGSITSVDIGEAGDEVNTNLARLNENALSSKERIKIIKNYIESAAQKSIPITLIASQSPYDLIPYLKSDHKNKINNILIAYDASVYKNADSGKNIGLGFRAVVSALIGRTEIQGNLPVKI